MTRQADWQRHLGTVHVVYGVVTVVAFLLTGQYMDRVHAHLVDYDNATRMLYRSTHLYILYAGLLNGAVGIGWRAYRDPVARAFRLGASLLLLILPILLLIGFAVEPYLTDLARPYTRPATYGALGVGILLLLGHLKEHDRSS